MIEFLQSNKELFTDKPIEMIVFFFLSIGLVWIVLKALGFSIVHKDSSQIRKSNNVQIFGKKESVKSKAGIGVHQDLLKLLNLSPSFETSSSDQVIEISIYYEVTGKQHFSSDNDGAIFWITDDNGNYLKGYNLIGRYSQKAGDAVCQIKDRLLVDGLRPSKYMFSILDRTDFSSERTYSNFQIVISNIGTLK